MAEEVTGCDHGFGWIGFFFYFCENVVVFNIFLDWKLERFKMIFYRFNPMRFVLWRILAMLLLDDFSRH